MSALSRNKPHVQGDEGFAVIWREAQRARSEVLGVWVSSSLWGLIHAGRLKLGRARPCKRADCTRPLHEEAI